MVSFVDVVMRCFNFGWTRYNVTEGLDVKYTACRKIIHTPYCCKMTVSNKPQFEILMNFPK